MNCIQFTVNVNFQFSEFCYMFLHISFLLPAVTQELCGIFYYLEGMCIIGSENCILHGL
jgi:hypothetical protein